MGITKGLKSQSPYASMDNNPIRHNDPKGDCPICFIGAIVGAAVDYGIQVAANYVEGNDHPWTNNINLVSIGTAAVAGFLTSGGSVVESAFAKGGVKVLATVANNTLSVKTSSTGLNVKLETSVANVVKNTVIDLVVAKAATAAPSQVAKQLSKIGINNGTVAKVVKNVIKSAGADISRSTNNAVKTTVKAVGEQVKKTTENAIMVGTNSAVDKTKENTNQ